MTPKPITIKRSNVLIYTTKKSAQQWNKIMNEEEKKNWNTKHRVLNWLLPMKKKKSCRFFHYFMKRENGKKNRNRRTCANAIVSVCAVVEHPYFFLFIKYSKYHLKIPNSINFIVFILRLISYFVSKLLFFSVVK